MSRPRSEHTSVGRVRRQLQLPRSRLLSQEACKPRSRRKALQLALNVSRLQVSHYEPHSYTAHVVVQYRFGNACRRLPFPFRALCSRDCAREMAEGRLRVGGGHQRNVSSVGACASCSLPDLEARVHHTLPFSMHTLFLKRIQSRA